MRCGSFSLDCRSRGERSRWNTSASDGPSVGHQTGSRFGRLLPPPTPYRKALVSGVRLPVPLTVRAGPSAPGRLSLPRRGFASLLSPGRFTAGSRRSAQPGAAGAVFSPPVDALQCVCKPLDCQALLGRQRALCTAAWCVGSGRAKALPGGCVCGGSAAAAPRKGYAREGTKSSPQLGLIRIKGGQNLRPPSLGSRPLPQ